MKKGVTLKSSLNLQENICVGVSFSIKLPTGSVKLHQIETPVRVFSSEFQENIKFFINLRGRLLLKSNIFCWSLFSWCFRFLLQRNSPLFWRNCATYFLWNSLNKKTFKQNYFFKITQETKTCPTSTTKKARKLLQLRWSYG